jgi:pimeloyl-ACP methyl ester carboxylesterase
MRGFQEAQPLPGAGRFLHWEQPEAFNRRIWRFIKESL